MSLSLLISQMSLLDWPLVKDLGVPKVCCALQRFLLEGFGEWISLIFVTRDFPALHLCGLETSE